MSSNPEPNTLEKTVSVPLDEGEVATTMPLDEYARKLAQELHRVKAIIHHVSTEEIGARIEEVKISLAMYRNLFEILVNEHTKRVNIDSVTEEKGLEKIDLTQCSAPSPEEPPSEKPITAE